MSLNPIRQDVTKTVLLIFIEIFLQGKEGTSHLSLWRAKVLPSSVPVGKLSANQVELRLALLSLLVHPPTQASIFETLPRKLKFCMEVLFNRTRSTSKLASYLLATTGCSLLQLAMANSAFSSLIKMVKIGKLVYSASTIRLGVWL